MARANIQNQVKCSNLGNKTQHIVDYVRSTRNNYSKQDISIK